MCNNRLDPSFFFENIWVRDPANQAILAIFDMMWPGISSYGGFLKWWYPQIIHFRVIFHYKPSLLGIPPFQETPIPPKNAETEPDFPAPRPVAAHHSSCWAAQAATPAPGTDKPGRWTPVNVGIQLIWCYRKVVTPFYGPSWGKFWEGAGAATGWTSPSDVTLAKR